MVIAVTGASGFVGRGLNEVLTRAGHRVRPLVRREVRHPDEIAWDPAEGRIDTDAFEDVDAVVHLAGEPVSQRWTSAARRRILDSRVKGTALLALALAEHPPRVLVSASAIGIYGDRGDEVLTEQSAPGEGFLASVASEWEAATAPAEAAGVRVVHLRIGLVMDPAGGMLGALLPSFRWGLGGPMGGGRHWQSWIARDDLVALIDHALGGDLAGPLNATAPHPVRQRDLAKTLGRVLRRPALLPVPGALLRLGAGQMGRELLLGSQRVLPERALASGFVFRYPDLEPALRAMLEE